jgi:hypothetical protein
MDLKSIQETQSGLNVKFVNTESGRTFGLDQVITQIEKGNPNYNGYETVHKSNGTVYVRSIPNGKQSDNIE